MEPNLTDFSTNNDPPSEAIIREVKKRLLTPLHELAEITSEIAQLQDRLKFLTERGDTVQKSIDQYNAILSPVRRLPTDVLYEIFYLCLPIQRNPIMRASDAPMLLTRVCRSWRSLALASPRLWARLHITFCDYYRVREPDAMLRPVFSNSSVVSSETLRAQAEKTLQLRCEVVKEWLGRSGACPLSISLFYTTGMWVRSELDTLGHITLELFRTLLLFKERWREMELSIPLEIYRKFEAMVPVDALAMLSLFKGSFHEVIPESPLEASDPIVFLKAPNLERVSMSGSTRIWGLNGIPLVNTWSQKLTYLCCHFGLRMEVVYGLLKLCHKLEHVKLTVADVEGTDPTSLDGLIHLPHLRSFCILEDVLDTTVMARFYNNLDSPSLTWLDYQNHLQGMNIPELTNPDFVPPILNLLEKSNQLKKLTLIPSSLSLANMRKVLQLCTFLTHLVIGQEPIGSLRILSHGGPAFHSSSGSDAELETFLGLLTIGDDDSASTSEAGFKKEPLLRNLEVLEISAHHSFNISDEQLVRFITSRLDDKSPHGIPFLKQVRIAFNRVKRIDVVGEVARFLDAKGSGSGTKLELDYLSEPANDYPNPLSTSYPLTEDGRTWVYPDIVE